MPRSNLPAWKREQLERDRQVRRETERVLIDPPSRPQFADGVREALARKLAKNPSALDPRIPF